jgi:hypothetical protein
MSTRGPREVTPVDPPADPFDFPARTTEVVYLNRTFRFRELTVAENDVCRDLATDDKDVFDGRKMMRAMIVQGAIEPEMTLEQLERLPQGFYSKIIDAVNDLHNPEIGDDPGNS